MNTKKPATPKDDQPTQANYNGLVVRLLPIILVSAIQLGVIALLVSMGGVI